MFNWAILLAYFKVPTNKLYVKSYTPFKQAWTAGFLCVTSVAFLFFGFFKWNFAGFSENQISNDRLLSI